MSFYKAETWSLKAVAEAFRTPDTDKDNPRIIVPIFQRGLRWKKEKRNSFIDSLEKGYPFGSLLFAKQGENVYSVVDGLQRGSTICDFYYNPLSEDNIRDIDDEILTDIRTAILPGNENHTINDTIKEVILNYVHKKKSFKNVDYFDLALDIYSTIPSMGDQLKTVGAIKDLLKDYFKTKQEKYNDICDVSIPIIIYTGPNEYTNEIFNRINKQGVALNDYEIYAAIWDQNKVKINSKEVVQKVVDKYMVLISNNYDIDDFSSTKMLADRELTTFEYLFGLGKHWSNEFECLKVESKEGDDEVNELSFELVDACINENRNISNLDSVLFRNYNVNKLQRRIEEAIHFVEKSIATVCYFKGNQRKYTVLHSKYQIISLIAYTFREMYDKENLDCHKQTWEGSQEKFAKQLLAHYVADIILNEWHDGGRSKIFTAIRERRYSEDITKSRWESILDSYYQSQLSTRPRERFNNPTNADCIILNCVYNNIFTAGDQLSSKKFDIEHLATKDKMKRLLEPLTIGLPVSCIANQCYLPEDINRGKRAKTIYEAKGLSLPINEIEKKFSFTTKTDFDWLYLKYDRNSEKKLETEFIKFLDNRFAKMKEKFLNLFF